MVTGPDIDQNTRIVILVSGAFAVSSPSVTGKGDVRGADRVVVLPCGAEPPIRGGWNRRGEVWGSLHSEESCESGERGDTDEHVRGGGQRKGTQDRRWEVYISV